MGVLAPEPLTRTRLDDSSPTVYWTTFPARALPTIDWADPNAAHRAVMGIFDDTLPGPEGERRATSGILFRIDPIGGEPTVLVQSTAEASTPPPGTRMMRLAESQWALPSGAEVRFRVAVNPLSRNGRSRSETVIPMSDVPDWLTRRLGDALDDIVLMNHVRNTQQTTRSRRAGPRRLVLDVLDGVARVGNPATLTDARIGGVGRAKSYGAGLLTVQRIG